MHAILEVRPDAIFIQSESTEYFHASRTRARSRPAEMFNAQRFLSLDLNYGRRVSSEMYEYLLDNGMTREEYHFFLDATCATTASWATTTTSPTSIACSPTAAPARPARSSATTRSRGSTTIATASRSCTPKRTSREGPHGDEAVYWLWKEWANVLRVRNDGVPIVGFTWYSLTDQVDWDTALREQNGHVNPLGLYDLDRNIRAVGLAYKKLISDWRDVLPTQSVCLQVPVVMPSGYGTKRRSTDVAEKDRKPPVDAREHEQAMAGANQPDDDLY